MNFVQKIEKSIEKVPEGLAAYVQDGADDMVTMEDNVRAFER